MAPSSIVFNSSDWNSKSIVDSFKNTGFLLVVNPFIDMKGSLEQLREKLKAADLKTLPMYEEGRSSSKRFPGEANERVVLKKYV